jgi:hypothetical protein
MCAGSKWVRQMPFSEALATAEQWVNDIFGVERVAEGIQEGEPCITVFVSSQAAARRLPRRVGPWKVVLGGVHGRGWLT